MKYIFIIGAPGSKFSSLAESLYYSNNIDRSDYAEHRIYYGSANGNSINLMHIGSYFDPGMEYGTWFENIQNYSKEQCELEFDRPFSGQGIRIIKSHILSHNIDFIKQSWPDCPVILVHRPDDACLGRWIVAGHFNITYPNYTEYYKDFKEMFKQITIQNNFILKAMEKYTGQTLTTATELAEFLKLDLAKKYQNSNKYDSTVTVI